MIQTPELLTLTELAALSKESPRVLRGRVKTGHLIAKRGPGRDYRVTVAEAERYLRWRAGATNHD